MNINKTKRILVAGATGAMGQYLVPLLAETGAEITAVALDKYEGAFPNVHSVTGNFRDDEEFRSLVLKENFDAIVDFMIYPANFGCIRLPECLNATGHYIYLSSYRIYADCEHPIRETSPRLLDASTDQLLLNSDDYCIFKARGENIIRSFDRKNWTIIRPAITYSLMRYQLVSLEAPHTVGRAFAGKPVLLPEQARCVQATMSWAGDVARMIAGLLFNEKTLGETFTVATGEHHSWGEIADYYRDICNLQAIWIDKEDYLRVIAPNPYWTGARWQLEYDRLFHRVIDNSKILAATGITQDSLKPLYDGLEYEISRCPKDHAWPVNQRMDDFLQTYRK